MLGIGKYFRILSILLLFTVLIFSLQAQGLKLKFDHLTVNNGLPQNSVYSILEDKYGFMWFATWGGAVRYDGYTLKVFRANESDSTALSDNRINAIVLDSAQNVWIQTGEPRYAYKYNYEFENFTRVLSSKVSRTIRENLKNWKVEVYPSVQNSKYSWVSFRKKLTQTNRKSGGTINYTADINRPFSLSDNIINYMYIDKGENLWIGTQNGGINHAVLNIKPFSYYNSDPNGAGLVENVVRAVSTDKSGKLWVGSENKGLTVYDRVSGKNRYIRFDEKYEQAQRIRLVFCDKQGQMWIGTKGGLFVVNSQNYSVKNYSAGLPNREVFALCEDHENTLWVGTFNGLARYNRTSNKYECYSPALTGGKQIRAIVEDRKQNLWVATEDGGVAKLERTKSDKLKATIFVHKEGVENSLINNRTFSLAEDKDGMIWIATNSGLSRLNPTNNSFKNFTLKSGLPDDIIMGVLFDGKESVWVSHKKGLSRINIHSFELQNFNIYDGLQGNEFSQNTCYRDARTGEMFFGGTNGLNSFVPDSFKINRIKPRVVFIQLSVMDQLIKPGIRFNDRIILEKSLLCTNELTLTWWDKTFSIEFAALHFANPLGCKYKYKLDGYDKQWIFTTAATRIATYSNLPSGTYDFKVLAANSDGVWSDTPTTLRINVLPPWWFTWWAQTIVYLVLIIIALWIYRVVIAGKKYKLQIESLTKPFSQPTTNEPKKVVISPTDEAFLKKVTKLVEENLENENFDIDTLAEKLTMSRSQFYRKIKALTNKSLVDFVTTQRMNKALEYLLSGEYNISEVSYKVGYSSPNNFTRAFTKHFGSSPSKYIESLKNQ